MTPTKQKYSDLVQALLDRDSDRAKMLIEQGNNPNEAGPAYNRDGTVLHLALLYGDNEIIELLVEKGANVNALNKDGKTPLMFAICHNNNWAAAFFIEKEAELETRCNHGYTAHDYARFNSRGEVLEMLTTAIEQRQQQEAEQTRLGILHDTASNRQATLKSRRPRITLRPS